MASLLQLAASVMALRKPVRHAGGDSPQASPPKAAAKHVARLQRSRQLFQEVSLCHPPKPTHATRRINSRVPTAEPRNNF